MDHTAVKDLIFISKGVCNGSAHITVHLGKCRQKALIGCLHGWLCIAALRIEIDIFCKTFNRILYRPLNILPDKLCPLLCRKYGVTLICRIILGDRCIFRLTHIHFIHTF